LRLKIYLYSNDSRFFYKVNNSLKKLKTPIQVLNFGQKIRNIDGVVLTTQEEFERLSHEIQSDKFLVYSDSQDLEEFSMQILATHKFGNKREYSEIIFSIDPGENKSGMAIFLDEYFFLSKILYNQKDIMESIKKFISYFNFEKSDPYRIKIFLGSGVPSLVNRLLDALSKEFEGETPIFYLVDERKTSKIKDRKKILKISKHEISAIWIALRAIKALKHINYLDESINNNLKQPYRILNSEISFDENLYKEVFLGNLSISEALEREKLR
jgi:hypothetical protein